MCTIVWRDGQAEGIAAAGPALASAAAEAPDRIAARAGTVPGKRFGSGVVAPGTGVVLNNRAKCFTVGGVVEPGRRPYHTIIPGLLARGSELAGPFGVMGGFIQAQAHVQLVHALLGESLDPQTALDRPRFRLENRRLLLEQGLWDRADEVRALGLEPVPADDVSLFGGGQAVLLTEHGTLIGGSDSRKDGYAAGW